ncbi:MAG: phosphoserine transaminase [Halobacteriovoraceae bacterium]|jgi:phosphoserine aminotransferase|nr:phosphoserine transaminase [Halobacteriovoraceae bacterium]
MFESLEIAKDLYPTDPRFGVGPSLVPVEHLANLLASGKALLGTSHRQSAVRNLCQEVQAGLKKYFNLPAEYEVIIGNGGATFLFDMIGLGLVKKSSLHYVMGEFSNKWYDSHKNIPWLEVSQQAVNFGAGLEIEPSDDVDMICCTLNETSTGVQIADLPVVSKDVLLAVDATSGAGQIKVDFNKVDLYFFSPQKVFASEGGFYVAIMSPKALARAKSLYDRSEYVPKVMSWKFAIENSLKNQTYNTPAISTIFLLNEQIKKLNELSQDKVIELAKKKAEFIYTWAKDKEYLNCFVTEEKYRSQSVATIDLDEKYSASDLTQKLRKMGVVQDIEAYRKLGRNQFRISLFHNNSLADLQKLTKIISLAIENYS